METKRTRNKEWEKGVSVFLAHRRFAQDSKQFIVLGEMTASLHFANDVPYLENLQLSWNEIIFEIIVEITFEIKNICTCVV